MIVRITCALFAVLALMTTSSCVGCPGIADSPGGPGGPGGGDDDDDDGGDDDDDDDGTITDPNVHALFVGLCRYIERCPSDAFAIGYRDLDECADIVAFVFTCRIVDAEDGTFGVQQNAVDVTAGEAAACAAFLDEQPCAQGEDDNPLGGVDGAGGANPCEALVRSLSSDVGAGASCASEDCGTGLECVQSAEPNVCPVCVELLDEGAVCSGPGVAVGCDEDAGLVCGFDAVCTGPKADGASCLSGAECTSSLCVNNECISPRADGGPCTQDVECISLFCRAAVPGVSPSQCDTPAEAGGACSVDEDCRNRFCEPTDNVCGLPNASACSSSSQCQSGYCDPAAGCVTPRGLGGSCDNDEMCASKACDPQRSVCVLACDQDEECDGDDRCNDGRCRVPQTDGSSCEDDGECASGYCSPFSESCRARPGPGSPCDGGFDDCLRSDRCVNGTCTPKFGPAEACDSLDSCIDPWICIQGTCTLIDLQCRPAPAGDRCTYLRLCDDDSYCDFGADITCVAKKGLDEECFQDEQCLTGLACAFDPTGASNPRCAPRAGEGDDCSLIACSESLYCDRNGEDGASGPVCRPRAENGAPCDDDEECQSGDCFIDACEPAEDQCTLP